MSGRIGKVRMKDSGFEFRVIPGVADPSDDMGAFAMRTARAIASEGNLAGVIVVGLGEDGCYHWASRINSDKTPIPMTLMPSYFAELMRREIITGAEAETVFHQNFEWVE